MTKAQTAQAISETITLDTPIARGETTIDEIIVRKPTSGELRRVPDLCLATIGAVSNPDNMNKVIGKAGNKRHMGKRPSVRGVVMNPFDHPHGGGEGKSSGGRHPVTPWGKKTRGPKTRNNKSTDRLIIRRRNAKR